MRLESQTGGGPISTNIYDLNEYEERIIKIKGSVCYMGDNNVEKHGLRRNVNLYILSYFVCPNNTI